MLVSETYRSDYLCAMDLEGGRDVVITIQATTLETLKSPQGTEDDRLVCRFKEFDALRSYYKELDALRSYYRAGVEGNFAEQAPIDLSADSEQSCPVTRAERREIRAAIQEFLPRLPGRQRIAFDLWFFKGLSFYEIGLALGITTDAAYQLVTRALQKIVRWIGEHF